MLHIHFGAGRLGLGLVAPFFQTGCSELQILNRSVSTTKPTAETSLGSSRRNELLRDNPSRRYLIQTPGGSPGMPREVRYDGFATYDEDSIDAAVASIIAGSSAKEAGIVVTASLVQAENYRPVIRALNRMAALGEADGGLGPIFFVACENALSAEEVLGDSVLSELVAPSTRQRVTPVRALVDRLCVELEEVTTETGATLVARAELYGSLKLELNDRTERLRRLCAGSRVSFSRHIDAERKIKSWLVNGSHWLIALAALEANHGDQGFALNQYLAASDKNRAFAVRVMEEMKEGVGILIRTDPQYADFASEVDVGQYLEGAASAILKRFFETEDPITRILARFRAPSSEAFTTIEAFSKRFNDRVGEPIRAYEHENGVAPPAASHSLFSMLQLVASGSFIEDRPH
jgi:hypothetical protein